jgi:hypothetical protein
MGSRRPGCGNPEKVSRAVRFAARPGAPFIKTVLMRNRDVLAGLLFIALGAAGWAVALSYPFGTLQEMGPGFFPRVLGLVLIGFGLITAFRGLRRGHAVVGAWGWIPLAKLSFALVAFGWLMEHAGLVPALVTLIVVSASAGKGLRLKEVLVLTVLLCVMAWAIFVWGLGLPYALFSFGGLG